MESIVRSQATAAQVHRLEDATQNPLTSPHGHDNILQGRRRLPVYRRYQEVLDRYNQSQVIILSSETGLGKLRRPELKRPRKTSAPGSVDEWSGVDIQLFWCKDFEAKRTCL